MKRKILPVSRALLAASSTAKLWHRVLFFSQCQYERTCLGCCCTQFKSRDTRMCVRRICLFMSNFGNYGIRKIKERVTQDFIVFNFSFVDDDQPEPSLNYQNYSCTYLLFNLEKKAKKLIFRRSQTTDTKMPNQNIKV